MKVDFLSGYLSKTIAPYSSININLNDANFNTLRLRNEGFDFSNWTIVIQGPVGSEKELNYLQKSLRDIHEISPEINIVICSYLEFKLFTDLLDKNLYRDLILLSSTDYKNNFERQVASTAAGLTKAKEYKSEYSIKLRVDQRLRNPASIYLFDLLLGLFRDAKTHDNFRIIFSSYNSWLYRIFGLSDMLTVGSTDELIKFWNFNNQIEDYDLNLKIYPNWLKDRILFYESFLCMRYLNYYNFNFTEDKYVDYARSLRDFFLVVDSSSIGHEWLKRNRIWSGNSIVKAGFDLPPDSLLEVSFSNWLLIKNNLLSINPNELASRH